MPTSPRTVLVVTGMDMTADAVIERLNLRGVPVARFDVADFPLSVTMSARYEGGRLRGVLETPSRAVDLTAVRAIYYRRPTAPVFPMLSAEDEEFAVSQARHGLLGALQTLPDCLYVNSPRRSAAAEWKASQLALAGAIGFRIPPTIISNSLEEISAFANQWGAVVYKPITHVTYRADGEPQAIWVREVDPKDLDESLALTAHMFQAKVKKVSDIRVTVVGDQVFCVRIKSPYLDWRERYDLILEHQVIEPPDGLASMLRKYLDEMGLVYGCFDFGLDDAGEWWWYECNPSGEWGWIEAEADLPISSAFADILERGVVQ